MENATKALLMAAGVLMGMLILSIGVYLFVNFRTYIDENNKQMETNELNKFNTQFLKYNETDENGNKLSFSFQDVMTAANLAYDNNKSLNLTSDDADEGTYYIKITAQINNESGLKQLQEDVKTKSAEWLSNNYDKKYIAEVKISQITGRVYEVNFRDIGQM